MESYLRGEYVAAVILGGTCAEAAHKFKCRAAGMNTRHVDWKTLIYASLGGKLIYLHIGSILQRIRTGYRNKWVHVDIDQIAGDFPIPPGAGIGIRRP